MARAPSAVLQVPFPPSQRKAEESNLDSWHVIEACLVFFSTFEELKLQATGPMDRATTKLYEPSSTPILYVAPCELMLGRVPLFPCFLQGNPTPAILHNLASCATSRAAGSSTGQPTQQLWMAVGGAMCIRSTCCCGSLGAGGLA